MPVVGDPGRDTASSRARALYSVSSDVFIGLMSGTSLDGIDGVVVDFSGLADASVRVLADAHRPFDAVLRTELLALNASGADELRRAALAGNALARAEAAVVAVLLARSGLRPDQVVAIGSHGQTVRHCPGATEHTADGPADPLGFTVQLDNPALLAELTGIDVVADLRRRDVAAGGQGAPLVPAFHRAVFGRPGKTIAVLNIGGIANLSLLWPDGRTTGFDCGPGNVLMDHWAARHIGTAFDDAGRWAASGRVIEPLLAVLRSDAYFGSPPPKSTGRDRFHPDWLAARLGEATAAAGVASFAAEDIEATLAELTASICADDLLRLAPMTSELLVCGGGAFNRHLMSRLARRLTGIAVMATDERGLSAMQVEACAFAWLAQAFHRREPGNLAAVTGAAGPRLLGALYPGRC